MYPISRFPRSPASITTPHLRHNHDSAPLKRASPSDPSSPHPSLHARSHDGIFLSRRHSPSSIPAPPSVPKCDRPPRRLAPAPPLRHTHARARWPALENPAPRRPPATPLALARHSPWYLPRPLGARPLPPKDPPPGARPPAIHLGTTCSLKGGARCRAKKMFLLPLPAAGRGVVRRLGVKLSWGRGLATRDMTKVRCHGWTQDRLGESCPRATGHAGRVEAAMSPVFAPSCKKVPSKVPSPCRAQPS